MSYNIHGVKSNTKKNIKDLWNTTEEAVLDARDLVKKTFVLDACSSTGAQKVPQYITPEQDTFKTDWGQYVKPGDAVWMNPPFSLKQSFLKLAREKSDKHTIDVCVMVPLVMASKWWMECVYGHATKVFIPDTRYHYINHETKKPMKEVPFASCFVLFSPQKNKTEYEHFSPERLTRLRNMSKIVSITKENHH